MTQVASVDYANKRIYLHSDTVVNGFDSIAAYAEIVEARYLNVSDERNFYPIIYAQGHEPKGGGRYTPRRARLVEGARYVPYDTDHVLVLLTETIIPEEGLTQQDCFDRSSLSAGVVVDIDNQAPQVEIIEIATGAVNASDIQTAVWGAPDTTGGSGTMGALLRALRTLAKNIFGISAAK